MLRPDRSKRRLGRLSTSSLDEFLDIPGRKEQPGQAFPGGRMRDHIDRWWTSADGLRLYARDYAGADGDARLPVVCIHGLTRNSKDFEDIAPAIAATGRRVLVLDVRGRGRSDRDKQAANYQVGMYAADVLALLDALGIARAAFIGTSMGGLITMTLAMIAPARVAAGLLNDVGPELDPAGITRIAGYAGKPVSLETWDDAAAYAERTNGAAFPGRPRAFWNAFARRVLRDEGGRPALDYDPAIASAVAPGAMPDLWPLFAAFAAGRPIALVRGALSDLITAEIAARMQAAAPHLDVTEVAGVGHAPMLDEPEAADAINRFLAAAP
jgi:pimeloyl-ACP methyl ester carboxylesterase